VIVIDYIANLIVIND